MGNKLGLDTIRPDDITLISELEKMLAALQPDITIFYQLLMEVPEEFKNQKEAIEHFSNSFYKDINEESGEILFDFLKKYLARIDENTFGRETAVLLMQKNNPRFILRNYLLHQAIEELEKGEDKLFKKLQQAIKDPYSKKFDEFFVKRPEWANEKAGCSMLSCSS